MHVRSPRRARVALVVPILLGILGGTASALPAGEEPSAQEVAVARLADLEFLVETIRRTHPEPERRHARDAWNAEIARLRERCADLGDAAFYFELARLVASLGDGHSTLIPAPGGIGAYSYPIELAFFDDGLFVLAADRAYEAAVGKRIVAVGGRPIAEVLGLALSGVGCDNEHGARMTLEMALPFACFHEALVPTRDRTSRLTVEDAHGERLEIPLAAPRPAPPAFHGPRPEGWAGVLPAVVPLHAREPGKSYFVEYLEPEKTVYIRFRRVEQDPDERIAAFCRRAFALVDERGAERIVVDLRGNRGGNNYLTQPLVHGVIKSRLDQPGRVFVLTDGKTFSAAQNCASYLERETWALFAGSPTGGAPNHCGDAETFVLPETGHVLLCSTVRWTDSDPRDGRRWIYPDLPVETRFADFVAGRDPVLEAVHAYVLQPIEGYTGILPRAHWQRATQAGVWPPGR